MMMVELPHISARLSCCLECPPLSGNFLIIQLMGIGLAKCQNLQEVPLALISSADDVSELL